MEQWNGIVEWNSGMEWWNDKNIVILPQAAMVRLRVHNFKSSLVMTLAPEVPVLRYERHCPILYLNQAQATIRKKGCCNKAAMYLN